MTATADNCLLTNYPFLTIHRNDYHIVCENNSALINDGDDNSSINTEMFLLPCITSNRPLTNGSTSGTSTTFCVTSSSYEASSNPVGSASDTSSPVEGINGHNGIVRHEELQVVSELRNQDLTDGNSPEELSFFKEVLKSLQR